MTIDEMIAVMQAHKEGKKIRSRMKDRIGKWEDCPDPLWNFHYNEYQVAPEKIVVYANVFKDYIRYFDCFTDALAFAKCNSEGLLRVAVKCVEVDE